MNKIVLAMLLVCAWIDGAQACFAPPPMITQDPRDLVDRTPSIAVAEAISFGRGTYRFRVERSVKGTLDAEIALRGEASKPGYWHTTYDDHTAEEFWRSRLGRLGINGDCTVLPGAFIIGARYLLFIGGPPDTKMSEQIAAADDRWLAFVEQRVKAP